MIATRLRTDGLDPTAMATVQQVFQPESIVVDRPVTAPARAALPHTAVRLRLLLFVGVMTGGQLLLTSTVEEKSNA